LLFPSGFFPYLDASLRVRRDARHFTQSSWGGALPSNQSALWDLASCHKGGTEIAKQFFDTLFKYAVSNAKYIYSITPWSRVVFDKLKVPHVVKKFRHFMEPKVNYRFHKNFPNFEPGNYSPRPYIIS
jgi:hypothetical protein